ncbi:MAG: alpha/beta fold hydrolase [Polyangiaceae bacterium]
MKSRYSAAMNAAKGVGAMLIGGALCGGCAPGVEQASVNSPPVPKRDEDSQRCHDFMTALVADSSAAAERDFGAQMREQLPPPFLQTTWHGLQTRYGAFGSWRVAERDSLYGKDRFHLEVQFANAKLNELVVFDSQHEIVGLFFAPAHSASRVTSEPAAGAIQANEVEVSVGPYALRGTLLLPLNASSGAPVPGVVFVAGSGPSDRDETVHGMKPFRDLARGLAARGIASLRFEKRTFAHPESFKGNSVSVESETIEDAIAAVAVLRARPELDAQRLVVLGHSLGALLAPEIATRAGGVNALVLLAAPGRPVPEIILEQLRAAHTLPETLSALEAKVHALPGLPPNESLLGVPASYWQDLAKRDEFAAARALARPVLLLRGTEDQQVAAVDQERWIQELTGHVPLESASLPGLSHLFTRQLTTDAPPPQVSNDAIERIAAFVHAQALKPSH